MIAATTAVALPLAAIALIARRFRSSVEEVAWRLLAITMVITPIALLLPKVDLGFSIPLLTQQLVPSPSGAPRPAFAEGAPDLLVAVYAIVAAVLLIRLTLATLAAELLRRRAIEVRVPVTVGIVHPMILLPRDAETWPDEKRAAVLAHEREHVLRRDPLWRFVARLGTVVCWFQPFAWLAAKSIDRLAEEAADHAGVVATGDRHAYADVLLDIASTMTATPRILASSIHDSAALGPRIDAILVHNPKRPRAPIAAVALLAAFVAGSVFAAAMTKVEATATPQTQWSQQDLLHARDAFRTATREKLRSFFRSFRG